MKNISLYINESLVTSKPIGTFDEYKYHPETKEQLTEAIRAELINKNYDLNCIDTSAITDMNHIFSHDEIDLNKYGRDVNIDISQWDVSNVKDMGGMFAGCYNLSPDIDISQWDTGNVKNMQGMFSNCVTQNFDISNWNVKNVKNMQGMFAGCRAFNQDLGKWDVSNVTSMICMFQNCDLFEGKGLENWNIHKVTDFAWMFNNCIALTNTVKDWDIDTPVNKDFEKMFNRTPLADIYGRTPKIENGKFVKI